MRRILFLALLLLAACSPSDDQPVSYIKVGTGAQVGVYYTAGLAIADLVNEGTDRHQVDMAVESTDGSVFNINAVLSAQLDFGFAQADRVYQAVQGQGLWEGRPQEKLRFVCSFHPEMLALVAAEDSGIQSLDTLKEKRVSIGSAGSGTRGTALAVLGTRNLIPERDFDAEDLKASEAAMMLQDQRIDAFFYAVGHPNGSLTEATNGKRRVRFVPLNGLEDLFAEAPYYESMTIPMKYYPQAVNSGDVATVGVLTTLVSSSDVPDEIVYEVVRALFDSLPLFQTRHPSFEELSPEGMLRGSMAPLHPGAERYFREKQLIREDA